MAILFANGAAISESRVGRVVKGKCQLPGSSKLVSPQAMYRPDNW